MAISWCRVDAQISGMSASGRLGFHLLSTRARVTPIVGVFERSNFPRIRCLYALALLVYTRKFLCDASFFRFSFVAKSLASLEWRSMARSLLVTFAVALASKFFVVVCTRAFGKRAPPLQSSLYIQLRSPPPHPTRIRRKIIYARRLPALQNTIAAILSLRNFGRFRPLSIEKIVSGGRCVRRRKECL